MSVEGDSGYSGKSQPLTWCQCHTVASVGCLEVREPCTQIHTRHKRKSTWDGISSVSTFRDQSRDSYTRTDGSEDGRCGRGETHILLTSWAVLHVLNIWDLPKVAQWLWDQDTEMATPEPSLFSAVANDRSTWPCVAFMGVAKKLHFGLINPNNVVPEVFRLVSVLFGVL